MKHSCWPENLPTTLLIANHVVPHYSGAHRQSRMLLYEGARLQQQAAVCTRPELPIRLFVRSVFAALLLVEVSNEERPPRTEGISPCFRLCDKDRTHNTTNQERQTTLANLPLFFSVSLSFVLLSEPLPEDDGSGWRRRGISMKSEIHSDAGKDGDGGKRCLCCCCVCVCVFFFLYQVGYKTCGVYVQQQYRAHDMA